MIRIVFVSSYSFCFLSRCVNDSYRSWWIFKSLMTVSFKNCDFKSKFIISFSILVCMNTKFKYFHCLCWQMPIIFIVFRISMRGCLYMGIRQSQSLLQRVLHLQMGILLEIKLHMLLLIYLTFHSFEMLTLLCLLGCNYFWENRFLAKFDYFLCSWWN